MNFVHYHYAAKIGTQLYAQYRQYKMSPREIYSLKPGLTSPSASQPRGQNLPKSHTRSKSCRVRSDPGSAPSSPEPSPATAAPPSHSDPPTAPPHPSSAPPAPS